MIDRRIFVLGLLLVMLVAGVHTPSLAITSPVNHDSPQNVRELSSDPRVIVFDYSHGQFNPNVESLDLALETELVNMGYDVVWAWGGINSTILSNASGLVIGAIYGISNTFQPTEIIDIQIWFNMGHKFLWVGTDSDYSGWTYINEDMSAILESVGSHVYPEPTSVVDPISNCGQPYQIIANKTSDDEFVSPIVEGVSGVLMQGPTLLYGSDSAWTPGVDIEPVALEATEIDDVYPLLYYGESAMCNDLDIVPPLAHTDGETGAFVCATLETHLGLWDNSIAIVSGSSPYGNYQPMFTTDYYGKTLDGDLFVKQVIDFGIKLVSQSTINSPPDITYEQGVIGNFIIWQPFDLDPKSYDVTVNGELVRQGLLNYSFEVIIVFVDGLSVGQYLYTLHVTNQDNAILSDSVSVSVLEQQPPLVNHPHDLTLLLGNNDSEIVWQPSDLSLLYYEVYKNGELINSHIWLPWENTTVSVHLDGLSLGVHNYTIRIIDRALLETIDTVIVQVVEQIGPSTEMLILMIAISSAIVIIVGAVFIFRRK